MARRKTNVQKQSNVPATAEQIQGQNTSMRVNGGAPPTLATHIDTLNMAEQMRMLREFPAFQHIMVLLQQMVVASLKLLEGNEDPKMDSYFKLQWRSFKKTFESINFYMDGVIQMRREAVKEMLLDLGFDEKFAEANSDFSFQGFQLPSPINRPSTYPRAASAQPASPFAGASEE